MTTLTDIGREAQCSAATVSRAIRGDRRISDRTRSRVIEVARRLHYRPDLIEPEHSRHALSLVGLVIPNIGNSHFNHDTSLLHDALASEGYRVILCCHYNDASTDREILRSLAKSDVAGIVHIPCTAEGAEGVLGDGHSIPIVELGFRSASLKVDAAFSEERPGLIDIVQYLANLGHERIAMITGRSEIYHVRERTPRFVDAIVAAGLDESDCPVLYCRANAGSVSEAISDLVRYRNAPTAILAANAPAAMGVLLGLKQEGITVPDQISVVGLSGESWFEVSNPALTSYELPLREEGLMAAQLLLGRLRSDLDSGSEPRLVSFTGRLVVRESTSHAVGVTA